MDSQDHTPEGPRGRPLRGVLVSMPWATVVRPSLALGILTSICEEEGVDVECIHANLDMAARVGAETAAHMSDDRSLYGMADHFFACDVYGPAALESDKFFGVLGALNPPAAFRNRNYVRQLRDRVVPEFLDELTERVLAFEPDFVGFSATFNQVMGSLALARRLKRARPQVVIIAGGACFDGEMGEEYQRALPDALDHVFMGEAEESFREFLHRMQACDSTAGIPGVTWYADGAVHLLPGQPIDNLELSPAPDYDPYFRQKSALEKAGFTFQVESLPFESSRGCWWGQKSHCAFCGINDAVMRFREKDVDRIINEMVALSARYRVLKLTAADWIISGRQRAAIFEGLASLGLDIECFYETRIDLSKHEVALMKAAGVTTIQPGIESLSTELLHLVGKGTSRIRVVQFMRWTREYGIRLSFNILAGLPGEDAAWYRDMAAFIPHVLHLKPPDYNLSFIEMHRFSPLFERKEQYQVTNYEIRPDYLFNFPEGEVDLLKVGYFFNYESAALASRDLYMKPLREAIGTWIAAHARPEPPRFEYRLGAGFMRVSDHRSPKPRSVDLSGLPQDIVLLCDEVQHHRRLKEALAPKHGQAFAAGAFEAVVDQLVAGGILMREGSFLLTLPIGSRPRSTEEIHALVFGLETQAAQA